MFCVGKPAVKHRLTTPCYPSGVEIFLVLTVAALLVVVFVDTSQKRRAYLCQQEGVTNRF